MRKIAEDVHGQTNHQGVRNRRIGAGDTGRGISPLPVNRRGTMRTGVEPAPLEAEAGSEWKGCRRWCRGAMARE
jgi:hypothetical protein